MKLLSILLQSVDYIEIVNNIPLTIGCICFDSRKVKHFDEPNVTSLYVAQRGTQTDGHLYISQSEQNGARVIVCETLPPKLTSDVCYIHVADSSIALGQLASCFYDFPSRALKLIGITGTNGKTTTVTLLHRLFTALGNRCGLLSTIVNRIGDEEIATTHTTPDALTINALLRQMVDAGCTYCFMEVSSHAVCQHRIEGLHFTGGIFSNITHDHLDFHKTFANYIQAKKSFFDALPKTAFALTNIDDKNGNVMVQNTKAHIYTYSIQTTADFKGKILENNFEGLHMSINGIECNFRLCGLFNAYNLLAIYGSAILTGAPADEVLIHLSSLTSAEGRFQVVRNTQGGTAIIDYAHTPDALQNVLNTIQKIIPKGEEIMTVVGCGGNRDALKRPIMANIACQYSHRVILTSDNPRLENPTDILNEMQKGVPVDFQNNVLVIENRHEAIKTACMIMRQHGVILIAGKGHEKYQDINGTKHHFDDIEEVKNNWNIQ